MIQKTIEGKPAPAKQFHKPETENVGSELKMLVLSKYLLRPPEMNRNDMV